MGGGCSELWMQPVQKGGTLGEARAAGRHRKVCPLPPGHLLWVSPCWGGECRGRGLGSSWGVGTVLGVELRQSTHCWEGRESRDGKTEPTGSSWGTWQTALQSLGQCPSRPWGAFLAVLSGGLVSLSLVGGARPWFQEQHPNGPLCGL